MTTSGRIQSAPLVWINGFPGVGKLTIAREVQRMLGYESVTFIDNHTLIDPVQLARDHPEYQEQRHAIRQNAFNHYVLGLEPALLTTDRRGCQVQLAKTIIFTDFQTANELGSSVAREYQAAAAKAGRLFLPVYLECEREENVRRAVRPERTADGKGKLVDRVVLEDFLSRCTLFEFEGVDGLRIDVTGRTPAYVAAEMVVIIRRLMASDEVSPS
ncbi:hypothetical protein JX265_009016 [Neoarthrinium moseri]|uniref:Uncharacterized protein n=1 Tax=Neoarthrinium moseri TaxID=1658444 RepID=A0A9Q0AN46_9PEZI|nr:hypothetical protein JX265_009016 [Neoarthrinium moseri]